MSTYYLIGWEHLEIEEGLLQEGRRTGVGENGGLYFFRMDAGELNQVMKVHGPEVAGSVLCKSIQVDERRYSDSGSVAGTLPSTRRSKAGRRLSDQGGKGHLNPDPDLW